MHPKTTSKTSTSSITEEEKMGLLDSINASSSDADSEHGNCVSGREETNYLIFSAASSRISAAVKSRLPTSLDYVRSTRWRTLLVRLAVFFVPSFLQGRHAREAYVRPSHKMAPTAYLDGIRGLAALFVYFCHYSYQAFVISKSWGTDEDNYSYFKLPFLRIWYQGPAAVSVFFVISGYALSYKPLKLARSRNLVDFTTTMSSLTFRRFLRLYLPTTLSTFLILCLLRLGFYEWTRDFAGDGTYMKNVVEPHPALMENAYDHFMDWAWKMFEFVSVFNWDIYSGQPIYDVHLWTIPVEFRCSLYLFLVLLGTARLQSRFRFIVVGGILWLAYRHSRWDFMLFLCGMLLAETDHIRGVHTSPQSLPIEEKYKGSPSSRSTIRTIFWTLTSILGIYLLCQPDDGGDRAPGWVYLTSLIPEWWGAEPYRYWQSTGAVVFVLAVGHSATWQRFFNSGPIQYLGKISYAIYLMHAPAMHCMGYHWEKWAYGMTGVEGYWFNAGFVLGACFCVPTVIWWADVFWRAVDIPAVKFARWVEQKCIVKE